jgi:signal transduction histidine kinase
MTAPSAAWLLLDRDSRPPVALPVPRQACLGLTRAVLFQGSGWRHGGAAAGAAWQAAWEQAGGDPAVAVCLASWERHGTAAERLPLRWIAAALVLGDDVRSGRAAGAIFLGESAWADFVTTAAGPRPVDTTRVLSEGDRRRAEALKLAAAVLAGAIDSMAGPLPPAAVVDPAAEALVLRDAVQAAASLEASAQRFESSVRENRLAGMRELAYGASHEINNPLANIAARAQALLVEETDPERRRRLSTIVDQAFRARDMIGGLMIFARPPRPRQEATELGPLLAGVLESSRPMAAVRGARLEYEPPVQPFAAWVDGPQFEEAVRAVVVNALEAVDPGGRVELSVTVADPTVDDADAAYLIRVADNGRGMDEETARRAIDPFFSGREAGRGIGLGLSKAWRLIDTNGGVLEIDSRPGHGTCVTIRVPRSDQSPWAR